VKKLAAVAAVAVICLALVSCSDQGSAPRKTELSTFEERASYALGMDVASSLLRSGAEVDADVFMQGFRDTLEGHTPLMTTTEVRTVLQEFSNTMRERAMAKMQEEAETNLAAGAAFLEANKVKDGVHTTATGLQYIILEEGTGPKPTRESNVSVHYTGTLIDGTTFDSSVDRGQPATFPVGGVISGWTEALQLMSVGSKYQLFIPAELAYGERGSPPGIPPNAALIFDVELLEITE